MSEAELLRRAAQHAVAYLESLESRPVSRPLDLAALRAGLDRPLPEAGLPSEQVIDELVRAAEPGLLACSGGRFFGWVIGGTHPAALAADWLTATWDQNAGASACSPASAVVEEVCGRWLKDLLGLPAGASFALVTGCQMAHATALAAARHRLLRERGWDVECDGLSGAPSIRVLTSEHRHESLLRALRFVGIGSGNLIALPCDDSGRIALGALESALAEEPERPTVVSLQAGDLNSGAFDPFAEACALAHGAGAWVHVDGAFGLWANVSERTRPLLAGVEQADSWATDGHKWLNLPFDSGFVFVADPRAHSAAFAQEASYSLPIEDLRNPKDWNPEWSRRARAFPAYAAIRALGRAGIAALVERCCDHATAIVEGIESLDGVEVLARPQVNQGLLRFLDPGGDPGGDHCGLTDRVCAAVQADGRSWFGPTSWRGLRAMRVSVCSWRTTESDVAEAVEAVRDARAHVLAARSGES